MQSSPFTYSNDSILIRFLTVRKYRFYRHLLLVLMISIMAINITVMVTSGNNTIPSYRIIFYESVILTIIYLSSGYFNLYFLVPRLLLKHKYVSYLLFFFGVVIVFELLDYLQEYLLIKRYQVYPGKYSYHSQGSIIPIEIVSNVLANAFGISGASFTLLLRQWIISGERINELKKNNLKSELEQLKNQINPHFLFNLLDKTGTLVRKSPAEASRLLINLSKLLRYQLYDSTRSTVLLSAEISYLDNFLKLEQIRHEGFIFTIQKEVNLRAIMVPPLLFIPFVEGIVRRLPENENNAYIHLLFESKQSQLIFKITGSVSSSPVNKTTESPELINVERRLNLLYKESYSLTVHEQDTTCEICLILHF